MGEVIRFVICAVLMAAGLFVILMSVFGVFRVRFLLNRVHCASSIDTLGALLVLCSLMVASGQEIYIWKLVTVIIFLWLGSPLSSHLVSRTELLTDDTALEHMEIRNGTEEDDDGIL